MRLRVIGGGLAGCEAAWQAARQGAEVDLYEMRPTKSGPAHKTGDLAELVCSNSFRGTGLANAVGLLKVELARLDSIIVTAAHEAAVPAGTALAVDRERFSRGVEARITAEPRVRVHREEIADVQLDRPTIIACGPLPSEKFLTSIDALIGRGRLHYFDAASPIVSADSIDESKMYRKSRYEKGDGDDYLNIPLDREQYLRFVNDLRTLPRHEGKAFEETRYFEGCLPIEEMADRGDDVLRFGPMKPVGLRDPRTGKTPHAVVQLRKENLEGTAYNLVGFQTRLTWPAQREAFGRLAGLDQAEWLRLGVMHRNTFINAPQLLDETLRLRGTAALYFAGQITGAEGYVEAAACGAMTGIHAARALLGLPPVSVPRETALGAVVAHLLNRQTPDFQPSNVTWGAFPEPVHGRTVERSKRRALMAERALTALERFVADLQPAREYAGTSVG